MRYIIGTIALCLLITGCGLNPATYVVQGAPGPTGSSGADGHDGAQGPTGAQGSTGPAGADAPVSPYSIVEIMNPCGNTSQFHEVFFRLANGAVLADFSDNVAGDYTRLSLLVDGVNLMTTDHTGCTFDLTTSGGHRTITYQTGGSETWTVTQ